MRITGFGIPFLLLVLVSGALSCPSCTLKSNILKSARQTALCAYLMKTLVPSMVIPDILVPLVRLCPVLEGFAVVKTPCDGFSMVNPKISLIKAIEPVAPVNIFNPIVKPPVEVVNPFVKTPLEVIKPIVKTPLEAINFINPVAKPVEPVNVYNPVFKSPVETLNLLKPFDPVLFNPFVKPPSDPLNFLKPIDPFLLNSLPKPVFQPPQNPALTVLSKTSVDAVLPAPALPPPSHSQPYTAPTPSTDAPVSTPKQEAPPKGHQYFPPPGPQFNPPHPHPYPPNAGPPQGFSMSSNSLLLQNYK